MADPGDELRQWLQRDPPYPRDIDTALDLVEHYEWWLSALQVDGENVQLRPLSECYYVGEFSERHEQMSVVAEALGFNSDPILVFTEEAIREEYGRQRITPETYQAVRLLVWKMKAKLYYLHNTGGPLQLTDQKPRLLAQAPAPTDNGKAAKIIADSEAGRASVFPPDDRRPIIEKMVERTCSRPAGVVEVVCKTQQEFADIAGIGPPAVSRMKKAAEAEGKPFPLTIERAREIKAARDGRATAQRFADRGDLSKRQEPPKPAIPEAPASSAGHYECEGRDHHPCKVHHEVCPQCQAKVKYISKR